MRKISVWNPWSLAPNRLLDWDDEDLWEEVAMDVYEEGDNVIVKVKAPGFKKDQIDVSIEAGKVTIVGNAKDIEEEEDKKRKYYRKEIAQKSFTRSCELPVDVVPGKSKASFQDGILEITLPKSEEAKPKKISIDVN